MAGATGLVLRSGRDELERTFIKVPEAHGRRAGRGVAKVSKVGEAAGGAAPRMRGKRVGGAAAEEAVDVPLAPRGEGERVELVRPA